MISTSKMTIFDFVYLKKKNFSKKYCHKQFLGNFDDVGKIDVFVSFFVGEGGVGSGIFVILRIFMIIFFLGHVIFLKMEIVEKRKFGHREGHFVSAK